MDIAGTVAIKAEHTTNPVFGRQCDQKVRHETQAIANDQAKAMHKRYHKRFNAYKCSFCDGFHVGAQRSREAAMRRDGA